MNEQESQKEDKIDDVLNKFAENHDCLIEFTEEGYVKSVSIVSKAERK